MNRFDRHLLVALRESRCFAAGVGFFAHNERGFFHGTGFGGATVPNPTGGSFDGTSNGLDQLFVVSNTKTFGSTLVNEARLSATRLNNNLGVPQGGVGTTLSQQGIAPGGEVPLRVFLDAGRVRATGYRLYLFYP